MVRFPKPPTADGRIPGQEAAYGGRLAVRRPGLAQEGAQRGCLHTARRRGRRRADAALTRTTMEARTRRLGRRGLRPGVRRGTTATWTSTRRDAVSRTRSRGGVAPASVERGRARGSGTRRRWRREQNQERHGAASPRARPERAAQDRDFMRTPNAKAASPGPATPGGLTGDSLPDISNAAALIPAHREGASEDGRRLGPLLPRSRSWTTPRRVPRPPAADAAPSTRSNEL